MQWFAEGAAPSGVVARLTQADAGRAHRQVHVLDAKGASAAHTGSECVGWCGHLDAEGFSVAGNMLVGDAVIAATAAAYRASAGQPLAERLIAAMAAGQAQGGDKRGQQSAALRIHAEEDYPALDIRVDDHAEPIEELHRLYLKSLERFQPFIACLAGRLDPVGLIDRAAIEETVLRFQAAQAARGAPAEPESAPR